MLFSHDSEEAKAHAQLAGGTYQVPLSHELLAGAASYEAAKAYTEHCERRGKPVNHDTAAKLLAGFTGFYVDRYAETKGAEHLERHHLKQEAERRAEAALARSGQS